MADIIKLRRDTAANWTAANPILAEGEMGIETDTKLQKNGDGTTAWNSLPYMKVECESSIGDSEVKPMSQKAVTNLVNNVDNKVKCVFNKLLYTKNGFNIGAFVTEFGYQSSFYSELLNIPTRPCVFRNIWKLKPDHAQYAALIYLDKGLRYVGHINTGKNYYEFDPSTAEVPEGAAYIALNGQIGDGVETRKFIIESDEQLCTGLSFTELCDTLYPYNYLGRIFPTTALNYGGLHGRVMWLASSPGTYVNYGNIKIDNNETAFIKCDINTGEFSKDVIKDNVESLLNKDTELNRNSLFDTNKYSGEKCTDEIRLILAEQGHKELYYHGYIDSSYRLKLGQGDGANIVFICRIKPNSKYYVNVPYLSGQNSFIGAWAIFGNNIFDDYIYKGIIHGSGTITNYSGTYLAITVKLNNEGDYNGFEFNVKNDFPLNESPSMANFIVKGDLFSKAVSYVTALGTTAMYFDGYVGLTTGSENKLNFTNSGSANKLLIARVRPGIEYYAFATVAGNGNLYYSFYDKDFNPIDRVTRHLEIKKIIKLTPPDGSAYFAMTMEINGVGDYKTCFFKEITEYDKRNNEDIQWLNEKVHIIGDTDKVNLVHFPWKNGGSFDSLRDHYISNVFFRPNFNYSFVSDDGYNQKILKVECEPRSQYVDIFNFRIYKKDFGYQNWLEKFYLNIYSYISIILGNDNKKVDGQCFISLFYGVNDSYIEGKDSYIINHNKYIVNYINGALNSKSSEGDSVSNNPDKSFESYSANLGYNIPIYPTILDENGNELEFTGLTIQMLSSKYNEIKEYDIYPVVASIGENSLQTDTHKLPYSVIDIDFIIDSKTLFDDDNKINESLLPNVLNEADEIISPLTSDKMAFYGCSYTESYYAIRNKSWINKLSNLLDLPIMNFGVSGNRIVDMSLRLRQNGNPYGSVGIKDLKPTYVVIQNIGNETLHTVSGATLELYMQQIREMVENIKAIGATPMLGTDFFISNRGIDTQLKKFADELGIIYCPIGTIGQMFQIQKYDGFWGSNHPATRTNEETTEEWFHQLRMLNVRKSVKIFRVRTEFESTVSSVSDLNYDSLSQRLRKFSEIGCGELGLKESNDSWKYYDSLNIRNYQAENYANEYAALIGGSTIGFNNYALIEFVSSKVKAKSVVSIPCSTEGLKFYVKNPNIPVQPYSTSRNNGAFFVSKAVWEAFNANVGDKFTSTASGDTQISYAGKVKGEEYGGYVLIFTADSALSGDEGTLTNVNTLAQISYSKCVSGLSRYTYGFFDTLNKPTSEFIEINSEYIDEVYRLNFDDYKYWEYDKLRIIIQKSGAFSLGSPSCTVIGGFDKNNKVTKPTPKQSGDSELCSSTGFGNGAYNNVWTKEDGVLYEQMPSTIRDYPQFTSDNSHVVLTEKEDGFSNKIYQTFTIPDSRGYRKMYIRVSARLFPKIYNQDTNDDYHTTDRQITPTSNDYGRLECYAKIVNSQTPVVLEALVGPGWSEKFFELLIPPFTTSVEIGFYRNPHDFQETEKLARNWPMQVCDISVSMHNM